MKLSKLLFFLFVLIFHPLASELSPQHWNELGKIKSDASNYLWEVHNAGLPSIYKNNWFVDHWVYRFRDQYFKKYSGFRKGFNNLFLWNDAHYGRSIEEHKGKIEELSSKKVLLEGDCRTIQRSKENILYYQTKHLQCQSILHAGWSDIHHKFLLLFNAVEESENANFNFEKGLVLLDAGKCEEAVLYIEKIVNAGNVNEVLKSSQIESSDFYIDLANGYSEASEYEKAIEVLNDAIKKNPENKEAYFSRAVAYFETGDFEKSLKDYIESGMKSKPVNEKTDINMFNFSLGLSQGIISGGSDSALEFIPSVLASATGLGRALWALVQDPVQTSVEFVRAIHSCVEFVKSNNAIDTIGMVLPEMKELVEKWDSLSTQEQGKKIGYITGKYGIEIFAGAGVVKGVKAFRDLKRANSLLNLESMALSQSNKASIITKTVEADTKAVVEWEKAFKNKTSPTQANSTIGWNVGDPIHNLTKEGKVPKWSTVRQRHWKNKAHEANLSSHEYSDKNLKRMRRGLAPQRLNGSIGKLESLELHHNPPQRDGGLFDFIELWPDEHSAIDPKRYTGH